MEKYNIIKAGYRLTIKSWENDLDSRQIRVKDGLSEDAVKFIIDLCKLHKSHNGKPYKEGFGNLVEPDENTLELYHAKILTIISNHACAYEVLEILEEDKTNSEHILYCVADFMYELLDGSEFYYTRVYDSCIVEYVPEEIKILDVTNHFQ